jgi:hypothetical protein
MPHLIQGELPPCPILPPHVKIHVRGSTPAAVRLEGSVPLPLQILQPRERDPGTRMGPAA